ncbi:hypothetical protein M9H77_16994 [Catharanthus roseus]|uniref:Uncharacterized protein n=1 Tax=Catharanthus roseus TaxID=4058 RepID=A0ACC0B3A6_CATRO|nr:hypothetical protein M9H77_16994 [Catharanthus roseus]
MKKKKGKGLIGTWDQDSSESEVEEKANICFMALENEVQSLPSNSSNLIDDICDDDPFTMLIEMYGECEKGVKTIWKVKENPTNIHGPKKMWVPKVIFTSFVGTQIKAI